MATTTKAQRLTDRINRARRAAGMTPASITPATLTLQRVEAEASSLNVTPESLLIGSRGVAA